METGRRFNSWKSGLTTVSLLLLSRVAVVALGAAGSVFGIRTPNPGEGLWHHDIPIIGLFARWDSAMYLDIALIGYWKNALYAFRPLFPFILNAFHHCFGNPPREAAIIAGFAWNLACLVPLGLLFHRLTALVYDEEAAQRSTMLLAVHPSTLFLTATYPQTTYLLLVVAAFYLLETDRVIPAGLLGLLAGLTRTEGAFLFIPFLFKYIYHKRDLRYLFAAAASATAFPAFMLLSHLNGDGFFTPLLVQMGWDTTTVWNILRVYEPGQLAFYSLGFITMSLSAASVFGFFMGDKSIQDRETPYFTWALALLTVFVVTGEIRSWSRLTMTIPPVIWGLSQRSEENPRMYRVLLVAFTMLMSFSTVSYVNWYQVL